MTLRTGNPRKNAKCLAFTLIELIVVMTLLVVVIGLGAPSLSRFFRGRAVETEASRFVALTRYAQSEAVTRGKPMVLWVNMDNRTYGMREEYRFGASQRSARRQSGLSDTRNDVDATDDERRVYELSKDVNLEIDRNHRITNSMVTMRFVPDGTIDEASLAFVVIRSERDGDSIPIMQSSNRLRYEITTESNLWAHGYR